MSQDRVNNACRITHIIYRCAGVKWCKFFAQKSDNDIECKYWYEHDNTCTNHEAQLNVLVDFVKDEIYDSANKHI
jgi:hypothetical protein